MVSEPHTLKCFKFWTHQAETLPIESCNQICLCVLYVLFFPFYCSITFVSYQIPENVSTFTRIIWIRTVLYDWTIESWSSIHAMICNSVISPEWCVVIIDRAVHENVVDWNGWKEWQIMRINHITGIYFLHCLLTVKNTVTDLIPASGLYITHISSDLCRKSLFGKIKYATFLSSYANVLT